MNTTKTNEAKPDANGKTCGAAMPITGVRCNRPQHTTAEQHHGFGRGMDHIWVERSAEVTGK